MSGQTRLEPAGRWFLTNLIRQAIYLAVVCAATGIMLAAISDPVTGSSELGSAVVVASLLLCYGAVLCGPGAFLWLLLMANLPVDWSKRKRRMAGLLATPLIGGIVFAGFLRGELGLALLYGLLLPAGSARVVRLREAAGEADRTTSAPSGVR